MIKVFSCYYLKLIYKLLIFTYYLSFLHEFSQVCFSKIAKISLLKLLKLFLMRSDSFQRYVLFMIQGIIKKILLISRESIKIQIFVRFCRNKGLLLALANINYNLMAAIHFCACRSIQLLIVLWR